MAKIYYLFAFSIVFIVIGCTARQPVSAYSRTQTFSIADNADTKLGVEYAGSAHAHPGESGFHLLTTGTEALQIRLALIEASEHSIDLQYFSAVEDTTGKLLLEAVIRAAKRGVRVRMLLDEWYLDNFDAGAVAFSQHRNIEVRIFNPFSTRNQAFFSRIGNWVSSPALLNHRMHNKALIVDNSVAIIGGRNLGDEYFDAGKDINLRDIDVFTAGSIIPVVSYNFDRFWNSNEAYPVNTLNLPKADIQTVAAFDQDLSEHWEKISTSTSGKYLQSKALLDLISLKHLPLIWSHAEFISDTPAKVNTNYNAAISNPGERIKELAENAQHEFIFFTPYFVPLDDGVEWLNHLVKKGISVRIVTSSLSSSDMIPAQAAYSHYREALVKGGVDLYEIKSVQPGHHIKSIFKPSSNNGLHAKIYMIDQRYLVIGSWNFDARSIKLNTEQVLVIDSVELGKKISRLFDELTSPDNSYHVIPGYQVPEAEKSFLPGTSIAWVTRENGKKVYYDLSPHAGVIRRIMEGMFSVLPIDKIL